MNKLEWLLRSKQSSMSHRSPDSSPITPFSLMGIRSVVGVLLAGGKKNHHIALDKVEKNIVNRPISLDPLQHLMGFFLADALPFHKVQIMYNKQMLRHDVTFSVA